MAINGKPEYTRYKQHKQIESGWKGLKHSVFSERRRLAQLKIAQDSLRFQAPEGDGRDSPDSGFCGTEG
ncbi:hypothetical protein llap_13815 [Limosa lapponica baueri]|uniref:Uncharacterized protein n=1 Tax=Limosa lapponica baueri TaxID=1758121 RepID=A0A2I0TPZ6_LIMLA|nr:hypothetical protein llap_13815 [Limosa lapponica baueri]